MQYRMGRLRDFVVLAAIVACTIPALASSASGQRSWRHDHPKSRSSVVKLGAFGGAAFPVGRTKDGTDPGWAAGALIDVTSPRLPIGFRLDGVYHRIVPSDATATGAINIWGGDFNLLFTIPGRVPLKPYLTAGAGLYRVRNNITTSTTVAPGSHTDFGLNGGAGLRAEGRGFGAFLETRYLQIFTDGHDLRVMPVIFGIIVGGL